MNKEIANLSLPSNECVHLGNYHIPAGVLWAHTLADLVATCSFPMPYFPNMKWRVKVSAYTLSSQV